eukprot:m.252911 g.252911  ORF g.252911 m.252911 type:complete len:390 (-) comp17191_c0_seq15:3498-4667(-)
MRQSMTSCSTNNKNNKPSNRTNRCWLMTRKISKLLRTMNFGRQNRYRIWSQLTFLRRLQVVANHQQVGDADNHDAQEVVDTIVYKLMNSIAVGLPLDEIKFASVMVRESFNQIVNRITQSQSNDASEVKDLAITVTFVGPKILSGSGVLTHWDAFKDLFTRTKPVKGIFVPRNIDNRCLYHAFAKGYYPGKAQGVTGDLSMSTYTKIHVRLYQHLVAYEKRRGRVYDPSYLDPLISKTSRGMFDAMTRLSVSVPFRDIHTFRQNLPATAVDIAELSLCMLCPIIVVDRSGSFLHDASVFTNRLKAMLDVYCTNTSLDFTALTGLQTAFPRVMPKPDLLEAYTTSENQTSWLAERMVMLGYDSQSKHFVTIANSGQKEPLFYCNLLSTNI